MKESSHQSRITSFYVNSVPRAAKNSKPDSVVMVDMRTLKNGEPGKFLRVDCGHELFDHGQSSTDG